MGAYLTAARRRRRVSIERAAEDTRIKREFLMRMESDEFDFLSPAYVRGFLRTYARFLHVDPGPLLDEFDRRHAHAIDASQIVALQRRARRVPKERRRLNNWALGVVIAFAGVLLFAIVGLLTGPEEEPQSARETVRPTASPIAPGDLPSVIIVTPTPTGTSLDEISEGGPITFEDGIEVTVVAANADCWVDITSDGTTIFSDTLEEGATETFTADETMKIVLGFPDGVELIVNDVDIGSPGGVDPLVIDLPEDIDTYD